MLQHDVKIKEKKFSLFRWDKEKKNTHQKKRKEGRDQKLSKDECGTFLAWKGNNTRNSQWWLVIVCYFKILCSTSGKYTVCFYVYCPAKYIELSKSVVMSSHVFSQSDIWSHQCLVRLLRRWIHYSQCDANLRLVILWEPSFSIFLPPECPTYECLAKWIVPSMPHMVIWLSGYGSWLQFSFLASVPGSTLCVCVYGKWGWLLNALSWWRLVVSLPMCPCRIWCQRLQMIMWVRSSTQQCSGAILISSVSACVYVRVNECVCMHILYLRPYES